MLPEGINNFRLRVTMFERGGMRSLIGVPVPGIEVGIAVSGVVLGALISGETRMLLIGSFLVVAVFAIFRGHAYGTEIAPGQKAMLYSLGFVICTGLLHGVGIGMGLMHRWNIGRLALHGGGSLVMAGLMGTMFLPHVAIAKSEPISDFGMFQTGMRLQLTGDFAINLDGLVKSHVSDGFVKSSRSRLANPEE